MNPLQEYPHLFANGKFKANTKYSIHHNILGIIQDDKSLILKDDYEDEIFYEYSNNCTLIARPIENMTGEEKEKWKSFIYDNNSDRMIPAYAKQTSYLLSIGVFPFNQEAFETGEVKDATEVKS